MADEVKRSKAGLGTVLLMAVAAGAGYWFAHSNPISTATPDVKQGTVTAVGAGSDEFAYKPDGGGTDSDGTSYSVSPRVPWYDSGSILHMGSATPPPCLTSQSKGQHISFGIVHFKTPTGTGLSDVVWVKCA
jgi:hypothetical protein